MSTAVATVPEAIVIGAEERAMLTGDLGKLDAEQRSKLYFNVCQSLGLNPLTQPFAYLQLNNKLTLYARKDCTDQLRSLRGVSIDIVSQEVVGDIYIVTARATLPSGRHDTEIGAVSVAGLRGDSLANAYMRAYTKAKRRATLSVCGLGFLDETEVETIPGATVLQETLPRQPQLAQSNGTNTATGEVDMSTPAPKQWLAKLADLAAQINGMQAVEEEVVVVPNALTKQQATDLKAAYILRLAELDEETPL